MTARAPMRRAAKYVEADMKLPEGMTCADCIHVMRCCAMFGHIPEDEVCDFAPSRFYQRGSATPTKGE